MEQAFHGSPLRNWHSVWDTLPLVWKLPISFSDRLFDTVSGIKLYHTEERMAMVSIPPKFTIILRTEAYLSLGVYLARDGLTSTAYYTQSSKSWQKSLSAPSNCIALAEIVNLPSKFVSKNPHYVVKDTHWIMW